MFFQFQNQENNAKKVSITKKMWSYMFKEKVTKMIQGLSWEKESRKKRANNDETNCSNISTNHTSLCECVFLIWNFLLFFRSPNALVLFSIQRSVSCFNIFYCLVDALAQAQIWSPLCIYQFSVKNCLIALSARIWTIILLILPSLEGPHSP